MLEQLPDRWEGIPAAPGSGKAACIHFIPNPEPGFWPLQLFENTRYFLEIPDGCKLSASFELERVPGTSKYYFIIDNYLGTASLRINDLPPIYFDVISRKLEYHKGYRAIVEAIASQCNQLLLEWSAPTTLHFASDPAKQKQILLEQFLFLRHVLSSEKLDLYLETIRRNPHNSLVFEDEWKPAGTAVPAPVYFEDPVRFGRDWSSVPGGSASAAQVMTRRKYETLDTPANRFIKFALERFQDVCERVIRSFDHDRGTAWREAHDMRDTLDAFLGASFFREVGRLSFMPANNQTLLKREGYREILHAWLMLEAAAQLDWPGRDDAYDGTTRDVPTLYEYWLYFVMRQIMRSLNNMAEVEIASGGAEIMRPFIERSKDGLRLNLKQGQASLSAFAWRHPESGTKLRLHFFFNRTFVPHASEPGKTDAVLRTGSYSRPFRPDYSLVIFPEHYATDKATVKSLLGAERAAERDGAIAYLHFDAKYRVETLEEVFGKAPALPSPPNNDDLEGKLDSETMQELESEHRESATRNTYKRGDLLKMHTYNEAIRRTAGSYVLYPGNTGEVNNFKRFHEILPGVGAFVARPLMNGDSDRIAMQGDDELRNFIEDVLNIQQDKFSQLYRLNYWTHETVKEPPAVYEKISAATDIRQPPHDTTVLLGFMRDETMAELCLEKRCFYFHAINQDGRPSGNIDLAKLRAEYLVPYVGMKSLDWMARIHSIKLIKRQQLLNKLGKREDDGSFLRSDSLHYFVMDLDISDRSHPELNLSHVIPRSRDRFPISVKWSELFANSATGRGEIGPVMTCGRRPPGRRAERQVR